VERRVSGHPSQLNAEVACPFDIPEDAFQHRLMNIAWCMHMQAHLLHGVRDIRTCARQILQGPGNAPVSGGVAEEVTIGSG